MRYFDHFNQITQWQHSEECMCRLRNIAMCDYQESVTTGQMDRQTPYKVIPMCRYASQATQQPFSLSHRFLVFWPCYIFAFRIEPSLRTCTAALLSMQNMSHITSHQEMLPSCYKIGSKLVVLFSFIIDAKTAVFWVLEFVDWTFTKKNPKN